MGLFQCDVGGCGVGAELVDGLGADDRGGDGRAGQQPGQRDLVRLQAPVPAEPLDLAGERDLGVGEPGPAEALVAGDSRSSTCDAGEQPAVQRAEGDDRQPEPLAGRGQLDVRRRGR